MTESRNDWGNGPDQNLWPEETYAQIGVVEWTLFIEPGHEFEWVTVAIDLAEERNMPCFSRMLAFLLERLDTPQQSDARLRLRQNICNWLAFADRHGDKKAEDTAAGEYAWNSGQCTCRTTCCDDCEGRCGCETCWSEFLESSKRQR